MLSTEVLQATWHNRSKEEIEAKITHTGEVLSRAGGISNKEVFREAVHRRKEARRKREKSLVSFGKPKKGINFCSCLPNKDKKEKQEQICIWEKLYCKNAEDFQTVMLSTTRTFETSRISLRNVTASLSYREDTAPDMEGLSIIGGMIWILTFAVQHLMDESSSDTTLNHDHNLFMEVFQEIRNLFQDIGSTIETFLELSDKYFEHVLSVRNDGAELVQSLTKKLKFEAEDDPMTSRPELKFMKKHRGHRLADDLDDDEKNFFHVHWSPLAVVFKDSSTNEEWIHFGIIDAHDRIHIFIEYLHNALEIMDTAVDKLSFVTNEISSVTIGSGEVAKANVSYTRELTGAMLSFVNNYGTPGHEKPDHDHLRGYSILVENFWIALDGLHDDIYSVLCMAQETRDIFRTCYVYLEGFYKWKMPSYDTFIKVKKDPEVKKRFWKKLVTNDHILEKQLSAVSIFMTLSDFSTSVYQSVVQTHPVETKHMLLKVAGYIEDEKIETWGLVGGKDKRREVYS